LAIAHHGKHGTDILDAKLDTAIQHIGHIRAAIGDVFHLDARLAAEHLASSMLRRADAWRAVGYLAGIGAGVSDQFLYCAWRKIAVRHEKRWHGEGKMNWRQILHGIKGQALQVWQKGQGCACRPHQRIAIRRRFRDAIHTNGA